LKQDKYSIGEVTYMVGFSDAKYFRNCFRKLYGKTPSKYIEEIKKTIT
jgi:YesN/AraC family two-component response regulator